MSHKAVVGIAKTKEQADRIVSHLESAGFTSDDISVLFADREKKYTRFVREPGTETFASKKTYSNEPGHIETTTVGSKPQKGGISHETHTKAPEGAATGATLGGLIGGSLGLLAGIGALAIPGIGPFVAAGPLLAALGGSSLGGATGLVLGGLIGLGIPEIEAKALEKAVLSGGILISIHTDNSKEIDKAKEIFKKEGATEITSITEKSKASH